MTHICVSKLTIIASDNGLSPGRRQATIWTNAGILLRGPLGTHFCATLIEILLFSFKKMRLKVSSAKRRPFCLGLNVLKPVWISNHLPSNVWDEIIYPYPNLNGATVEVWEWMSYFISHFVMDGLKLNHVSKKGPRISNHQAWECGACVWFAGGDLVWWIFCEAAPHDKGCWIYGDVIMGARASQITSLTIVYWTVYSGADQRQHQSSASLAFGWGIHRWPMNSPYISLVTRKMFPFGDIIMDS